MKKIIASILLSAFALSFAAFAAPERPAQPKAPAQASKPAAKPAKREWANFAHYEKANLCAKDPAAVFMGDSITAGWAKQRPEFFKDNNYAGRGISGQTSSHMLVRFRADVINLKPKCVAILAGINDIAENNGPIKLEHVAENIASMAELGRLHGIKVILCSVLPSCEIRWNRGIAGVADKVKALNAMIKDFAEKNNFDYVDYYSPLADGRGGLPAKYSKDGVHVNADAYAIMEKLVKAKIEGK